jgi:hypothetical protein
MTSSPVSPIVSIMSGNRCVGFLFARGGAGIEAFNEAIYERNGKLAAYNELGKQIGSFETQAQARAAISEALIRQLESEIAWREHSR